MHLPNVWVSSQTSDSQFTNLMYYYTYSVLFCKLDDQITEDSDQNKSLKRHAQPCLFTYTVMIFVMIR